MTRASSDPLVQLGDDAALETAIRDRQERRDIAHVEADLATMVGTLRDLAERAVGVTILTDMDRRFQGVLVAVAIDHVVLATASLQHVHMPLDAVHHVRTEPGMSRGVARGDREAAQDLMLQERLARWQHTPPHVAVHVTGRPDPIRGRLVAVGEDVVTVHGDHDPHPTWIRLASVRCIIRDA